MLRSHNHHSTNANVIVWLNSNYFKANRGQFVKHRKHVAQHSYDLKAFIDDKRLNYLSN